MLQQQPDVSELWIQHQRRHNKTTQSWACIHCLDRRIFLSENDLWKHALLAHRDILPTDEGQRETFRRNLVSESASKRPTQDASVSRNPGPSPPTTSISALGNVNIDTPRRSEDVPDDNQASPDQPRKRAAIGDGIPAGSGSPRRDSSTSPPPRRTKARPTFVPYGLDEPLPRDSFDPSNIASLHTQKQRAQGLRAKARKASQSPPSVNSKPPINRNFHSHIAMPAAASGGTTVLKDEDYKMVLEPETRPISQEQLVAEVKAIYAGLVMVEAKCIEVDNKQATLTQADPGSQPKLNNEQWQALIALHRTLLHEHHDFFLASQHPSASPALRRLASKYAMPARMWRHGIHSFLELLRHRLPASLDHMLAFVYLAYSMMALLYETVPAFEDTWIECLGDLGRYRMAIEDDDIRDREVWTGVARHWYSKTSKSNQASCKLYHHLGGLTPTHKPGSSTPPEPRQYAKYASCRPARHYDGIKNMEATLRDSEGQERAEWDPLYLSMNSVAEIMIPGLGDVQSSHKLGSTKVNKFSMWTKVPYPTWGSCMFRFPDRHKIFAMLYLIFNQVQGVMAAPAPTGFKYYLQDQWYRFTQEMAGPLLVMTLMMATFGTVLHVIVRADRGTWKGSSLVLIAMIITTFGSFFVGLDGTLSPGQLVVVAGVLGGGLNFAFLSSEILPFPRSGGLVCLVIGGLGLLASLLVATWHEFEGRLADPKVLTAVTFLPTTVFSSLLYDVAFVRTTLAQDLEDGVYNGPILAFVNNFFQALLVGAAERLGLIVLFDQPRRPRHENWR